MLEVVPYPSVEAERKLKNIRERKMGADPALEAQVIEFVRAVRDEGDAAVVRFTRQYDAPAFDEHRITATEEEIESSYSAVEPDFLEILRNAVRNIESFHRHQLHPSHFSTRPDGSFLGQMVRPVASAGLYIPGGKGGRTPLISSVLMNAIPARLAGVKDVALITPPTRDGTINPYLMVAAREAGVSRVHKAGSAWGIAALAYGTDRIRKVDVIVGPGNIFVSLAKKYVAGEVGIDLLAGPSEILVIADSRADADYIAADLLSQAEHDAMASANLITTDRDLSQKAGASLEKQLERLPRHEIAREALTRYGAFFLVNGLDEAVELANTIAPEHLELLVEDPWTLLGKIEHAGAVFLGDCTPEAVGDYYAGPNHVLPTAGTARFASALGVENFIKRTSVICYSREALDRDGEAIIRLAELEGLEAHAASVRIRLAGPR